MRNQFMRECTCIYVCGEAGTYWCDFLTAFLSQLKYYIVRSSMFLYKTQLLTGRKLENVLTLVFAVRVRLVLDTVDPYPNLRHPNLLLKICPHIYLPIAFFIWFDTDCKQNEQMILRKFETPPIQFKRSGKITLNPTFNVLWKLCKLCI